MGKIAAIILALLGLLALAGCGARAMQDQLVFCDGAEPIRPGKGETARLSPSLVDQIHQHNEVGAKACGWQP